ncbi:hypothetical protein BDQ12DRAFT_683383 [Crucibulum laeve]|uniref:Uncharacterized protein n=1 Tax=Crucibulum laeve TaxID=68775 RepID=A0A5C3M1E6_9AGAR|nr:hypothetical protein BDQ12DRAFT_683383 [Crucibulum laeve]
MPSPDVEPANTFPIPTSPDVTSQFIPSSTLSILDPTIVPPLSSPNSSSITDAAPSTTTMPSTSHIPIPSSLSDHPRPISPPITREDPRSFYIPPSFTTTRTGRVSRPPIRLDPPIKGR